MSMGAHADIRVAGTVPTVRGLWLNVGMLVALAAVLAGAVLQDYRIVQMYESMQAACFVGGIAGTVGVIFCLAGAMYQTDQLLATLPAWHIRLWLVTQRRLFMLLQLAAAALIMLVMVAILFHLHVPGPDYGMLYRGGYTPPGAP